MLERREARVEGECSGRSLYWDTDVRPLCLLLEPTVLTAVVHILVPRRYNTGEPELIPALLGRHELPRNVMEERGLGGNRFFRPQPGKISF